MKLNINNGWITDPKSLTLKVRNKGSSSSVPAKPKTPSPAPLVPAPEVAPIPEAPAPAGQMWSDVANPDIPSLTTANDFINNRDAIDQYIRNNLTKVGDGRFKYTGVSNGGIRQVINNDIFGESSTRNAVAQYLSDQRNNEINALPKTVRQLVKDPNYVDTTPISATDVAANQTDRARSIKRLYRGATTPSLMADATNDTTNLVVKKLLGD
jgi:hypothetical protein